MKIYISGAISNFDIGQREKVFRKAEKYIEEVLQEEPINPFNNGISWNCDREIHMKADLKMLLECDAILMLKGWEASIGAKLEFEVASSVGIKVIEYCYE